MMQVICFEDSLVEKLRPITQARPAYAVTCASLRLVDCLKNVFGSIQGHVRSYLNEIQQLDYGIESPSQLSDSSEGILLVNARLVPRVSAAVTVHSVSQAPESCVVLDDNGSVLVAKISALDVQNFKASYDGGGTIHWGQWMSFVATLPQTSADLAVFQWPHDVVRWHMSEMNDSLNWRIENDHYQQLQDGVFVKEGVSIGEYASIDTSDGPILLDEGVQVGPFCLLAGPVYAGPGGRVIEHAALKDGVALGHTVKIGGEVEASVIEPFTNKQHHGFLGHSYLGSWINLGAGTCNSDLKNTYGTINIQYGDQKVATGMQFLGCFVGDYSKTAINTSIFTGKVIGVCSMMYGFVTSNVPSYVNYARLFGQTSLLPPDVMINTQKRMFARRKVEQRECDKQLIRDMYAQSADEREMVDQDLL